MGQETFMTRDVMHKNFDPKVKSQGHTRKTSWNTESEKLAQQQGQYLYDIYLRDGRSADRKE